MRIAVLSGKGGTGKTLVSVNLAAAAKKSIYIDCDVEEPNGYLFFKPEDVQEEISVKIPKVDNELCNGCRRCVDFCKFNALSYIKDKLIVFEEICHSCGGCIILCPERALIERDKVIGKIQRGISYGVKVNTGILNTGEASGIPIIKNLLMENQFQGDQVTFVDCPPGSACIVMESIKDVDYCILVAEPTLFGVHNLNMVYDLVKLFNKPFGVVLNKCLEGENPAEKFCLEKNIKILCKIPFNNELGLLNSNAEIVVRKSKKYSDIFTGLLEAVIREVQYEATTNS
ncbi:ATPase [Tissierella creatinini]|nr:ATPase [Tissierella creatinini]TJX63061.1 ATPase [Soehngenia saccharolytica]